MEIIVKNENVNKEWKFPCLVIENFENSSPSYGRKKPKIILAIGINYKEADLFKGVIIDKGDENHSLGQYIDSFVISSFDLFKGEIILRNN